MTLAAEGEQVLGLVPNWLAILLVIAIVLTVIAGGVASLVKLWPVLGKIVDVVNAVVDSPTRQDETDKRLAAIDRKVDSLADVVDGIEHELHPNSGASLRDAVDGVARTQTAQAASLKRLTTSHARTRTALSRVEKGVAGLYDLNPDLVRADEPNPRKKTTP